MSGNKSSFSEESRCLTIGDIEATYIMSSDIENIGVCLFAMAFLFHVHLFCVVFYTHICNPAQVSSFEGERHDSYGFRIELATVVACVRCTTQCIVLSWQHMQQGVDCVGGCFQCFYVPGFVVASCRVVSFVPFLARVLLLRVLSFCGSP